MNQQWLQKQPIILLRFNYLDIVVDYQPTSGCSQFYSGTYHFADQLTLHVNRGLDRPNEISTLLNRPTIHSFLLIKQ